MTTTHDATALRARAGNSAGPQAPRPGRHNPMPQQPTIGVCALCKQTRPVFPPDPAWGRVPGPLCGPQWSEYAQARDQGTFAHFRDAFDNATDEQLQEFLQP
ncbi:hypothetical protein [Actinomadura yumaensis]|uniref:Uncharacterized protein n=1 Tax=Actinomadura yumaensis TaxID=111807 RepID=A0ABW2CS86_9ACTN